MVLDSPVLPLGFCPQLWLDSWELATTASRYVSNFGQEVSVEDMVRATLRWYAVEASEMPFPAGAFP